MQISANKPGLAWILYFILVFYIGRTLFNLHYIGFEAQSSGIQSGDEFLQVKMFFNVLMSVCAGLAIYALHGRKNWGRLLSIIFLVIFTFLGLPNSVEPRPEWLQPQNDDQRLGKGAFDFLCLVLRAIFFVVFLRSKKIREYFRSAPAQ